MIDIRELRANPDVYREAARLKGIGEHAIDETLKSDTARREIISQVEKLRSELNFKGKPSAEELIKLQAIKSESALLEAKLAEIETRYQDQILRIPNLLAESTHEGGEENIQVSTLKLKIM